LHQDLDREAARKGVLRALREVQRRFAGKGIPVLDPVSDMGITSESFTSLSTRQKDLQARISGSPLQSDPKLGEYLSQYAARVELLEKSRGLRQLARESQVVSMKDELRKMKRVLKRLGYITEDGVLGTKGRFSCELSTADELVLTDMVFDGVFNDLSVEQTVSLLSCFVHKEGSKEQSAIVRSEMQAPLRHLQTVARNIAKVYVDAKLICDEEEYVKSFNPGLVDVTFAWASGAKFVDICKLTDVFEGSIIRSIRRLEELLRQLASAATAIGNTELQSRFEEGSTKIRRGVVFAASLYL
jgi:ATP-dependent RNA helicase DOB1